MVKHICYILLLSTCFPHLFASFEANWESLDQRPMPQWFDEVKFGIFLHWGVYSVPSLMTEWFWYRWKVNQSQEAVSYMNNNYKPSFTYQDFASDFTAEFFNTNEWAEIFASSGAKYVVLTSKHHEGYALWPSQYSYSWNAKDVGPNRDLVGELGEAVRAKNLKFGLYHSLKEWFHPLYVKEKAANWTTQAFVAQKILPEMKELVETYKPSIIWSDGATEAPDTYWNSTEFLAWLYNESPVKKEVVVNDRWGIGTSCKHGGFYSCKDRYNPGTLQAHKWENAMTIDKKSWGFRRNAKLEDYMTTLELLTQFVSTVSCGGNILMNIGPTKDGILAPIFQQRLRDIGKWLAINGEAIYSSTPWTAQNDSLTPDVWYTAKNNCVYAIVLFWPERNVLELESVFNLFTSDSLAEVHLLGNEDASPLTYEIEPSTIKITFPNKAMVKSEWAHVLQIKSL